MHKIAMVNFQLIARTKKLFCIKSFDNRMYQWYHKLKIN